jgi:hypothetical protein
MKLGSNKKLQFCSTIEKSVIYLSVLQEISRSSIFRHLCHSAGDRVALGHRIKGFAPHHLAGAEVHPRQRIGCLADNVAHCSVQQLRGGADGGSAGAEDDMHQAAVVRRGKEILCRERECSISRRGPTGGAGGLGAMAPSTREELC